MTTKKERERKIQMNTTNFETALAVFDEVLDQLAKIGGQGTKTYDVAKTIPDTNYTCVVSNPPYNTKKYNEDGIVDILEDIESVIYNEPATIVTFKDGSKVCVKASKNDTFNKEIGLVYAIVKRLYANDFDDNGYMKSTGLGEKISKIVKNAIDQKEIERQRRAKLKAKKAKKEADAKAKEANEAGENAAKAAVDQVYGNEK